MADKTLTKAQRQRLRAMIQPILAEEVAPLIKAEVGKLSSSPGSPDYLAKALAGSAPVTRSKDLPEAARIFARLGMIAAAARDDRATALDMAKTLDIEYEYKSAMSAGAAAEGGLLILDDMADDLIELLRPYSVMRRIGALEVPIPKGTKRTPRIDVGVTSGYIAEGAAIPASEIQTGSVILIARKLATLVIFSNELARFTEDQGMFMADQIILGDMLASMGQTEDVAFMFGEGTEAEPLGITLQAAADNVFDATQAGAAATLTEVQADLRTAENNLLSGDVPMRLPCWLMSPRSRLYLRDIRDTEDRGVFGDEMRTSKTLNGYPYFETNNIANTGGSGSNESKIILVDATQVMLGDVAQVAVDRSDQATVNIGGTDVSLFETDRSAIRTRQWNDIRLRHDVACSVIEAVKWGA